jgi:hypothetical protein
MMPPPVLLLSLVLAAVLELPAGETLRIAVVGDTGSGAAEVARGVAAVHSARHLDAIFLTGDNFYPCGVETERDPRWSLITPLTALGVPVYPVLGNHDSCGRADPDAQIRATGVVPNWRFPARQYELKTAVADFAFLDTTPLVRGEANQVEPAIRELGSSRKPWQIAVGHHPILSSGWHGYFPRDEVRRMRDLIPAVRSEGVDLYICGHDHHLELIRGRMAFLVSGAGSEPIRAVKLRLRTVFPPDISHRERIGFAVLEITKSRMRVRFYGSDGKPRSEWLSAGVRREAVAE